MKKLYYLLLLSSLCFTFSSFHNNTTSNLPVLDLCGTDSFSNAASGFFNDSGGSANNYSSGENCSFLIQPSCAQSITLSFSAFELENTFDILTIFDGSDASAPVLLSTSGFNIPADITSSGDALFITFTSDGSVTFSGWEATWTSVVPSGAPSANFSISNPTPALSETVVFSDQSTNFPSSWLWDFGDGSQSTLENPTHQYNSQGNFTVTLTTGNCFGSNTSTQMVNVQGLPNLIVSPTSLDVTVNCGADTIVDVLLSNTGMGDALFEAFPIGSNFVDSSQVFFTSTNTSFHSFSNLSPNSTNLEIEVVINGDFDGNSESASLFIEGNFIEIMPDNGLSNGTDIVNTYFFDAATIGPWLADGVLDINITNSADVDLNVGGLSVHRVKVTSQGVTWFTVEPSMGVVNPNSSETISLNISANGLLEGFYQEEFIIVPSNGINPSITIPINLNVVGQAAIAFENPCFDIPSTNQFSSTTVPLTVLNPSCIALSITGISFNSPMFSSDITSLSIPPFGSSTVMVTFSPIVPGVANTNMNFSSNAGFNSLCINAIGLDAPSMSIQPTSINVNLNCGEDSTIMIDIINSGLGDLNFSALNVGNSFLDSSIIAYDFTNITTHNFNNISSLSSNLNVRVNVNGDYDGNTEFASVFIEGQFIEDINDGNPTNGIDIIRDYFFDDPALLSNWLSDGILTVEIVNSSAVDNNVGGTELHKVVVESVGIDWLEVNPNTGTVNGNNTFTTSATISTSDLIAGNYTGNLAFSSDDPLNPIVNLPINLNVTGSPELSFNVPCVDFPSIMQFTTDVLPLEVFNTGCDDLIISNIVSTSSEFSAINNTLTISPFSFDTVWVNFNPLTAGTFNGNLQFTNNANSTTTICLTGSSFEAPIISTNPTSFTVNLESCSDAISLPLQVNNIGSNDLIFNFQNGAINSGGSSLDSVLGRVNNSFEDITALIPNFFSFSSGVVGTNIPDGGGDMYDTGNSLGVNNTFTAIPYSDNMVVGNNDLGTDGKYFTRKFPGLFIFGADINNVSAFNIFGNLGIDGLGATEGTILDVNFQGTAYRGFVKRTFGASDPSVNHLVIVKDPAPSSNHFFSTTDTDNDQHDITGINNSTRIYYILFAGTSGLEYNDNVFLNVMNEFLSIVEQGGFASLPNGTFVATGGNSQTFDIIFETNNTPGGTYNSSIFIDSNDPQNPTLEIPVTLNVSFDLCADFAFNRPVTCGGQVNFTNTSINFASTFFWDFGDGNTSTLPNPTHIYNSTGIFDVTLTVTNTGSTDMITIPVEIDQIGAPIDACEVLSTNNFPSMEITDFSLNTINNFSGALNSTYSDFTCDFNTSLIVDVPYDIEITSESFQIQNSRVWIDLDNNGSFENDELLFSTDFAQSPHIGILTIPSIGDLVLNEPLRCRVEIDDDFSVMSPCLATTLGEFEDYTVIIEPNTIPPTPDFEFLVIDDCQGVVDFSDLSTNLPDDWFWDFGDGTSSTLQNPIHTYTNAGLYNVTLTTTNNFGSNSISYNVIVNSLNPLIQISNAQLAANEPIFFSETTSVGVIYWGWDFGDGNTAVGQSVQHTYAQPGQYIVNLTIINGGGCQRVAVSVLNLISSGVEELEPHIYIYPNPSTGNFIIENTSGTPYQEIEIFNSIGQVVLDKKVVDYHQEKYNLQLTNLPDGVYWLKMEFEENEYLVKKLTVQH